VKLGGFQKFLNRHWIIGSGMKRARLTGGVRPFCAAQICLSRCTALFLSLFFLLAISIGGAGSVKAADSRGQLVMITSSHCPWCEAFEDDVGKSYDLTEEALIYPLRRHDFYKAMPDDLAHLTPATMTPTFIVVRNGVEVGRIIGYPGAELFWWRISEFTAQ
jgi:thioredoxin-related protein